MPQNPGPSIWMVDDDVEDQLLVQTAFDEFKPPVALQFFNDGQELVECLAQKPLLPQVILLDLNMPRLSGFEALDWLRQQEPFQQLPVVILTTSSNNSDIQKAFELGANGYFVKPVHYEDLVQLSLEIIRQWVLP